ncbi:MAG: hypothetical protein WDO56_16780 [Gammaproteobacteria bacterium]
MTRVIWQTGVIAAAALLAAACTTMGTGTGETRGGGPGVTFSWTAEDAVKGQMTATFDNGGAYNGKFFQITSNTQVDDMGPLWTGWGGRRRWGGGGWGYWDAGPEFITHYSGRVLANLKNGSGDHLRCNFRLVRPSSGMAGGGEGKCQLQGGKEIDATFPSA